MRFLAVLELFKQGLVDLDQVTTFGDIDRRVARCADRRRRGRALAAIDVYEG